MMKMGKKSDNAKIVVIICGIVGIFSIILYYLERNTGAWWKASFTILNSVEYGYLDAFGIPAANQQLVFLGALGILAGVLYLVGCIALLVAAFKEEKLFGIIASLMMVGGLVLYSIAVYNAVDYQNVLSGMSFLNNKTDYSPLYGTAAFIGSYSWGLGIGFIIAVVPTIGAIIASFYLD